MEPMEEVPSIIVTYSAPVRGRAFSVAGRWLGTRYRLTFGTSIYTFQRHWKTDSIWRHSRLCGAGSMRRYGVRPSVRPSDCTVSITLSGGRLPLLSARAAVTLAILKRAATSFAWVKTSRIYRVGQKTGPRTQDHNSLKCDRFVHFLRLLAACWPGAQSA